MPNKTFFHWNSELLGLGRQIGHINSWAFGVFWAKISAPILVQGILCPCFSLFNHYFCKKKTKKYLLGIGIWIWAAKNQGFSLHMSVVRSPWHTQSPTFNITLCVSRLEKKTYFIRVFLDFFLISTTFTTRPGLL
jgi:hypothetical protein